MQLDIIHRLCLSQNVQDRAEVAKMLEYEFISLPDKSAAWDDLHWLTSDENDDIRETAASVLGSVFSSIPDKIAAWDDLIRLVIDENWDVRETAASALDSAFSLTPDKSAAWDDLHRLTNDENWDVRETAAYVIGSTFKYIPDKSVAWDDLIRLTSDLNWNVRRNAASALGSAFKYIPDKSAAWDNLISLTNDANWVIRRSAVSALGSAFSFVSDKYTAWDDLIRLTSDDNSYVKMNANYIIGKICIYKASKSENEKDSRILLEDAILYFEKAAKENTFFNPTTFCYLFYRSFDAVLFKKVHSKKEIEDYIVAAKKEIGESTSKQKLIEAIEQLAEALDIAHNTYESGCDWRESLERCSAICNHVDQLMDENKNKTPVIYGLYKKVKPSFDESIKELITEVKEKTETACREARGTAAQEAVCEINKEIQELKIGSQGYMKKQIQTLYTNLKSSVPDKDGYKLIHQEIDLILNEGDLVNQYSSLNMLIPKIIQIAISEATAPVLDETKALREAVSRLTESIAELQNPGEYFDTIQRNLEEIKYEIPAMKKQIDDVLLDMYSPMGIDQKLKVAIPIIPLLASYEIETNVPKFVVDRIDELKNLVLKFKK